MKEKKGSDLIKAFLDFVSSAEKEYTIAKEEIANEDKITQDLLHRLEIEKTSQNERGKIATQLRRSRLNRRYYKDKAEELEPIFVFFQDPNNKKIINQLKAVLGETRKAERYHEKRTYKPRVLKEKKDEQSS